MSDPVTAQDFHRAYQLALEGLPLVEGVSENFQSAAKPWDQLTPEQQERFAIMAFRLNNKESHARTDRPDL